MCQIKLLFKGFLTKYGLRVMTLQKTIRIIGVSLALIALSVFAAGVVTDWNHHDSTKDARCQYCHLGHQAASQQE